MLRNIILWRWFGGLALAGAGVSALAQVPAVLTYQGRVLVGGSAFTGAGQLKLAIVSPDGTQTYWRNSADLNGDGVPDTSVAVTLTGGLFTVGLGDTNVSGMAALPPGVFTNPAISLRIWFSDGAHGVQQLSPDQAITSAAYALMAGNVADGAITAAKLSTNTAAALTAALNAQLTALSAQVTSLSNQYNQALGSGLTAASADPQDAGLGAKGFQLFSTIPAAPWVASGAPGAPSARSAQAGVWTGQQLLVWGGNVGSGGDSASGGAYSPSLDQWQPIPAVNAPAAREQHAAVWSGQEMLVWGGVAAGSFLNSGGRFNPTSLAWAGMSLSNAPSGRAGHVVAWVGTRMLVWGGRNNLGLLADGALYDPSADLWTPLALQNPPSARSGAMAVWTGTRLLIWGGENEQGGLNNGEQLLFGTNGLPTAWQTITAANAPAGRFGATAVWTSQNLLLWGGQGSGGALGDGAAYDPIKDSWTPLNLTNTLSPRSSHAAVWTGQEMLVYGGETVAATAADGAAYDPVADKWRFLSGSGAPQPRSGATMVWTGTTMICFGGLANGVPLAALQSLSPGPAWYLYRKP